MFVYLVGSLKNHERFEFCNIWDKLELVCQSLLSQAEIESVLINQDKRYGVKILQNLKNMWFYATLHEKISTFQQKISMKSPILYISQNF